MAQLVERPTSNQKDPGTNPGGANSFFINENRVCMEISKFL